MKGKRIAIAGMGRSGQAIAKAAMQHAAQPVVYDERPADTDERILVVERMQGLGAEVVTGWHGHLEGERFDMLVSSPGFRREHPAIRDALAQGKEVISEVEFAYRIARNPIVAVTGTNGKSTTTVMAWLLLNGAGEQAILCGNIAGSGYPELTLTEAALEAPEHAVLVAEVSSFQLEWVSTFRPKVAAITNITPDHLDRHPSFEDYYNTKLRIFAAMGEGDTAVVNGSGATVPTERVQGALKPGARVRTFFEQAGHSEAQSFRDGDRLVLSGNRVPLATLPLYGEHNVTNALMAWEMAVAMLDPGHEGTEGMIRALEEFRGLGHRLELLGERDDVLVINNSMCTNPMAVVVSSKAIPRRQHLIMGGFTKNLDYTPVREYLASMEHIAYVIGEDSELARQLGVDKAYPSLEEAFTAATASAQRGEAIVLAPGCMSTSPFRDFRERGEAFRRIAKEWLS